MSDIDPDQDLKKFEIEPEDEIRPIDIGAPEELRPREQPSLPEDILPRLPETEMRTDESAERQDTDREPPYVNGGSGGEGLLIKKGDYIDLKEKDPTLNRIMIGAGWEQKMIEGNQKVDVDLSCFLLDRTESTRIDQDFIYYNNGTALDGAIKHGGDSLTGAGEGDDETIFVDLNGVPFDLIKIMIILSIYDEEKLGKTFGLVRDVYVRIYNEDSGDEIIRFVLPEEEIRGANAIKVMALVREGPKWFAEGLCKPSRDYLNEICREYGLIIAEDTG